MVQSGEVWSVLCGVLEIKSGTALFRPLRGNFPKGEGFGTLLSAPNSKLPTPNS